MCCDKTIFSFKTSFNPIIEMFDEIPVLVSCWKKTYANHMLSRNISSYVFFFKLLYQATELHLVKLHLVIFHLAADGDLIVQFISYFVFIFLNFDL